MSSVRLPQTIEDVTSACLTSMLSEKYPGTEVTELHIGQQIQGTATKLRLTLDYNLAGHEYGLPPTMWMKGNFTTHGLADKEIIQETWFYANLSEEIGDSLPKCYFAGSDGKQGITLLEDLLARNVHFRDSREPASVKETEFLLENIAGVHGRYWESDRLNNLNDPKRESGAPILDLSLDVLFQPDNFNRCMSLPRCEAVDDDLRNIKLMQAGLAKLIEKFDEMPKTLMHGDPHFGNTYTLPHGKGAAFIDWQAYTRGVWAFDVAYFMACALSIEDRREHEKPLLQFYLDKLAAAGGPQIPFDEAWLRYRQFFFYAMVWVLCPPEMQPEEIIVSNAEKINIGLRELDSLGALGVER